jgi:O-antigen/teichoic acid export membrane protein
MSTRKNITANYLGAGVSALAPMLALPWYVSLLGTKYWGLASFVWVLQAILGLANAGFAQAIIREVSSLAANYEAGRRKVASILFGFERIYWAFAVLGGLLVALFADQIVAGWLNLGDIPVEIGRQVIYAAAVIFVVQFPVAIYRSVLFGTGEQVAQNVVVSGATIFRHLGGVLVLYVHSSIGAYLIWNVVAALAETLVTARLSWVKVGIPRAALAWDSAEMRRVLTITAGLSASVFIGILTLQVDKIVLSWSLPVEQLGYYAIASAVSVGLLQAFTPITSAMLPRIVQLQKQPDELRKTNSRLLGMMLLVIFVGALLFVVAGRTVLTLWLKNEQVVAIVYPVLSLLLVGTAMNAVYSVGYLNWVAAGATRKILLVNGSALALSAVTLPTLIAHFHLMGAAFGWLIINCVGMVLSLDRFIKGKHTGKLGWL